MNTLATSRTTAALADGATNQAALVDGFHRGLAVAAGIAAVGILAALASPRLATTPDDQSAEATKAAKTAKAVVVA